MSGPVLFRDIVFVVNSLNLLMKIALRMMLANYDSSWRPQRFNVPFLLPAIRIMRHRSAKLKLVQVLV
jgi:hypothetical protein